MKMSLQFFGFIICSFLLLCLMLGTHLYNGSMFVSNDELKFILIATGDIDYSPAHLIRMSADFIGYYQILKWVGSLGLSLEITGLIVKLISILFHVICIFALKRAGFPNKIILLTTLHPTLLFFAFSGVRDVIISSLCVVLAILYISRASIFWYALVALLMALVRIEAVLLPLTFFILSASKSQKLLVVTLGLGVLLIFLPEILLVHEAFVTQNRISGSGEGILSRLRNLPFPIDFLILGFVGLAGTYITPSTFALEASHEFVRQGIPFGNENFAPFRVLKALGILVSNFLFPALLIFIYEAFRRLVKGVADVFDQLLLLFSAIVFTQSWIAIDLGKASNYYYIIYAITLTRLAATSLERQRIIIMLGIMMLLGMTGLFLLFF